MAHFIHRFCSILTLPWNTMISAFLTEHVVVVLGMNRTGKNGNGSLLGAMREWLLAPPDLKSNDTASVSLCRINYLSQFKSSGGI